MSGDPWVNPWLKRRERRAPSFTIRRTQRIGPRSFQSTSPTSAILKSRFETGWISSEYTMFVEMSFTT